MKKNINNSSCKKSIKSHSRTKKVCSHPNQLFEKWLKEWKIEAENCGSNMRFSYQNAIRSLKKYPLPLYSGKDCLVLSSFGTKICNLIDQKLEKHVKQYGPVNWDDYIKVKDPKKVTALSKRKKINRKSNFFTSESNEDNSKETKEDRKRYVPAYRSGGYALLITLYQKSRSFDYKGFLTKKELIESSQDLCNASFTIPAEGSYYTAWSSMSILIKKNLVSRIGSPSRYTLTNAGESLAKMLTSGKLLSPQSSTTVDSSEDKQIFYSASPTPFQENTDTMVPIPIRYQEGSKICGEKEVPFPKLGQAFKDTFASQKNLGGELAASESGLHDQQSPSTTSQSDVLFSLQPNSYKIILNIDNTEIFGGSTKEHNNSKVIIKEYLEKSNIDICVRKLNVGDFLWTCQRTDNYRQEEEVVLPFIVERKRMDDLSNSIRDGRFKEQKFRLKQTGLTHFIYLVEECGSTHSIMPIPSCEQAITNTQIVDEFKIKIVKDQKESAAYLAFMTRYLQDKFLGKIIHCVNPESRFLSDEPCPTSSSFYFMNFKELNSLSAKNRSVAIRDMFAKHLLQIFGASVDKVTAVIQKYPTPQSLLKALEEAESNEERGSLLNDIRCGKSGRMVDQNVGSHIAKLYTWDIVL